MMKYFVYLSFVSFVTLEVSALVSSDGNANPSNTCISKLKNAQEYATAMGNCITKLKAKVEDIPKNSVELVEKKYDDKCVSKCVMDDLKFFNPNGTISRPKLETEIKTNAPTDLQPILQEVTKKCADSTEKIAKQDGGLQTNPCKFAAMFYHCFKEQEERVCKR